MPAAIDQWALETANRIKMLQAAEGDGTEGSRKETLRSEIDQILSDFTDRERAERKIALKAFFPAWNQVEVKTVEVEKWTPPRKPTPREALDQLVACANDLTEVERQEFARRLLAAGYKIARPVEAKPSAPPATSSVPESAYRRLGIKPTATISPDRLFPLIEETVDCLAKLSELAVSVDGHLYDKAMMERPPREEFGLRGIVARYLSGESSVSAERMRDALSKTRRRLAGAEQIPAELPRTLSERLKRNFEPSSIMALSERQGNPGTFGNRKKIAYWDTYERLWQLRGLGFVDSSEFWDACFAKDIISILERNE